MEKIEELKNQLVILLSVIHNGFFDNLINKPYSYSKHFKPVMWDGLYKQIYI